MSCEFCGSAYVEGYTDALDKAREAVDTVGEYPQPRHMGDPLAWTEGYTYAIGDALAAIDALKGTPNVP